MLWLLLAGVPRLGLGVEPAPAGATAESAHSGAAEHEKGGLPPNAVKLGRSGTSFVTNSMVVTWTVAIVLIVLAAVVIVGGALAMGVFGGKKKGHEHAK